MTTDPPRRRLLHFQRAEIDTAILEDLSAHGPSSRSEIAYRLYQVVGEHLVFRALGVLVEDGRVACERVRKAGRVERGTVVRDFNYEVNVYRVLKRGRLKRPAK